MRDLDHCLAKYMDGDHRVIFSRVDDDLKPCRCVIEDAQTGERLAEGDGKGPARALFDADYGIRWLKMWPDAPAPGVYPPDVAAAIKRGDNAYLRGRQPTGF